MARTLVALAAAAILVPFAAQAQTNSNNTSTTTNTTTYENPEQFNQGPGPSVGIMGDVDVNRFDRGLAGVTEPGVGYGARVDLSPARNLGIELGYEGSMTKFYYSSGQIMTNGAVGDLRINLIPPTYDLPGGLRPFVFGGAGYDRVDPVNFAPGVRSGNLLMVPVGAGLEANLPWGEGFLIGARFTYNFLFNDASTFGGRSADDWMAGLNIGGRI